MSDITKIHEYANGLRTLADLVEEHPNLFSEDDLHIAQRIYCSTRSRLIGTAEALGGMFEPIKGDADLSLWRPLAGGVEILVFSDLASESEWAGPDSPLLETVNA